MALDATGRARVASQWQRDNADPCPFTRADVIAAVAAVDDWLDANLTGAGGLNQNLPTAFRTGATGGQKRHLVEYVLSRWRGSLRAEED